MLKYNFNLKFLNYFHNLKIIQMIQCSKSVELNETFKKHHKPPQISRKAFPKNTNNSFMETKPKWLSFQVTNRKRRKQNGKIRDILLSFQLGYRRNAPPKIEADQFQQQNEIMREQDKLKASKKQLQKDCRECKGVILAMQENLLKIRPKYESQQEKQFQFKLQKTRIQNQIKLKEKEDQRLNKKKAMSLQDKSEISQEITRICDIQIDLIKKKEQMAFKKFEDKIIEMYLPLYKQLQLHEDIQEKSLSQDQKKYIYTWVDQDQFGKKKKESIIKFKEDIIVQTPTIIGRCKQGGQKKDQIKNL